MSVYLPILYAACLFFATVVHAEPPPAPGWPAAVQQFNTLFFAGKAQQALASLSAVEAAVRDMAPPLRVGVYTHIAELCLAASAFQCAIDTNGHRFEGVRQMLEDAATPPAETSRLLADGLERSIRAARLSNDAETPPTQLDALEKAVATSFQTRDFDRANLTIAQAAARGDDLPKAAFYARRGWLHFLSAKDMSAYHFGDLLPEYLLLFDALGHTQRTTQMMAIALPSLLQVARSNPYLGFKLALALLHTANAANDPASLVTVAHTALTQVRALEFSEAVRDVFETRILAHGVIACTLQRLPACDAIDAEIPHLIALLERMDAPSPTTGPTVNRLAAVALALHAVAHAETVPAIARKMCLDEPSQGTGARAATARSVYLAGRFFVALADKSDDGRPLIQEAARNEVQRIRHFLSQQPFEAAPVTLYSRVVFLIAGRLLAQQPHLSDADTELLLTIASLLNRTPRSIESQYMQLLAGLDTASVSLSLQALHRIEQSLFRAEKQALNALVLLSQQPPPQEPVPFDFPTWQALTDAAALGLAHDAARQAAGTIFAAAPRVLAALRQRLGPRERFITDFVAFDKVVHVCVARDQVITGMADYDAQATLLTMKTLQAALTNPSPASPAIDATFPVGAARTLTALVLGADGRCLGDAAHLIVAPDPGLLALPLSVLLDPAHPLEAVEHAPLTSVPWLGVTRAISVVIDAQELLASRTLRATGGQPFAFLGIGDPHLTGATHDGQPRATAVLRGVKRGAGPALSALDALPETRSELERLARLFGPTAQLLLGEAASEFNVRRQVLANFRVIGFATHGLLREEIEGVTEPALVLTPHDSLAETDDGLLTATEVSQLPLNADLVLLSACNSARFDLQVFGPEAASLSTAFFLAGAKATLASLWSVDSEATAQLMERFGQAYQTQPDGGAAVALRQTLQSLLSDPAVSVYTHPRFWAAFALFGDGGPRPPQAPPPRAPMLRPLEADAAPVSGDLLQIVTTRDDQVLLAGFIDEQRPRVTGYLRVLHGTRTAWEVRDPEHTFLVLRQNPAGIPPVLAVHYRDDILHSAVRWYAATGELLRTQPLPDVPFGMIRDFVALSEGSMGVVINVIGPDAGAVLLRRLDIQGVVQGERTLPLPAGLRVAHVRLFPASRGLWLSVKYADPARAGPLPATPFGIVAHCSPWRSELRLLHAALEDANDGRVLNDVEIVDLLPHGTDTDVAAVTFFDACRPFLRANAGLVFMRSGAPSTLHPLPWMGFSTTATRLIRGMRGGWTLIGLAYRELVPFVRQRAPVIGVWSADTLAELRRGQVSGRANGGVVAHFAADGREVGRQLFFTGAGLYFTDAVQWPNDALLLVGTANWAHFLGLLGP